MKVQSDFLVIGSGIAGLSFALQAAAHGTVALLAKQDIAETATNYAQGGIASVSSSEDSFDAHVQDTLVAGVGAQRKEGITASAAMKNTMRGFKCLIFLCV